MKRSRCVRNKGSVASLAFIAVVPLVAAIGGFAVDCMHVNDAKGELQRATDAAALAGGEDLGNYVGNKNTSGTSVSGSNEEPVNYALSVATLNAVDGPIGLWQGGQRSVSATIRYDNTLSGPVNRPNRCDVTGTIAIRSLFAQIFGNFGQTVTASSSAGMTSLNTMYSYAPLLVSLIDTDPNGNALNGPGGTLPIGHDYTVEIKSNTSSNSVWIFNANTDDVAAIEHIANPTANPGNNVPNLSVGDVVQSDNGQKAAGKAFSDLHVGQEVAFAVTGDSVSKDYLAQGRPVHTVIGFMVLKVSRADASPGKDGYSITGALVPAANGGGYNPNAAQTQITTFAPFLVRLVQ